MKRKLYKILEEWKKSPDVALVLKGPRQVGKTYAMKKFAKTYSRFTYINLEENESVRSIFENTNVAERIYEELSFYGLSPDCTHGKPLLVLDEIQACPKAYSALKPLVIDGRCDILSSCSLLGVDLMRGDYLSPMGYVRFVNVEPMDFEEFLWALGFTEKQTLSVRKWIDSENDFPSTVSEAVSEQFMKYLLVGGMPKAVKAYADSHDYKTVWKALGEIYSVIETDAMRYSGSEDKMKILACLKSIPSQLSKENKTFSYVDVEKISRSGKREYGSAIDWLTNAGIINICYNLEEPSEPLVQKERHDSFKIYVKDPGILAYMYGKETVSAVARGDVYVNKGALMESCIAQALISNNYGIHFFSRRNSTLEIDFIINYKGKLSALEVKSGKNKRAKSLRTITSGEYKVKRGIKIADCLLETDENGTLHMPLFGPSFFEEPSLPELSSIDMEEINRMFDEIS